MERARRSPKALAEMPIHRCGVKGTAPPRRSPGGQLSRGNRAPPVPLALQVLALHVRAESRCCRPPPAFLDPSPSSLHPCSEAESHGPAHSPFPFAGLPQPPPWKPTRAEQPCPICGHKPSPWSGTGPQPARPPAPPLLSSTRASSLQPPEKASRGHAQSLLSPGAFRPPDVPINGPLPACPACALSLLLLF